MTLLCRLMTLVLLSLASVAAAVPAFEVVAPGLEYREVHWEKPRPLLVTQLRCDPTTVRFSLLLASDRKGKSPTARAQEMLRSFQQTAVINCSYFDEQHRPLGYHERLGHVLVPDLASGGVFGGLFYWDGRRAFSPARDEALPRAVPVLFQAGPRLIWEGQPIPGLENSRLAARSGVSIDRQGRVTLFALGLTSATTLAELPALLSPSVEQGGMAAWRALNFDGGSSTQFSLESGKTRSNLPGLTPVPVFLGVSPLR
jgi:uncharacterized protein YigE (DUF2233 family)